jgi:hypothetical protein
MTMSGLMFALALFGCSDDATYCERLAGKAQLFETRAQCETALEPALESDLVLSADYPSVIADCMSSKELARLGKGPFDLTLAMTGLASR